MSKKSGNNLTYEQAYNRITEISQLLESGDVSLDESLKLFEESVGLISFCNSQLKDAELKIKTIIDGVQNEQQ